MCALVCFRARSVEKLGDVALKDVEESLRNNAIPCEIGRLLLYIVRKLESLAGAGALVAQRSVTHGWVHRPTDTSIPPASSGIRLCSQASKDFRCHLRRLDTL